MKKKRFTHRNGIPKNRRTLSGRVFATIFATAFLATLLFMGLVMFTAAFTMQHIGWGVSSMVSETVAREMSSQEALGRFGLHSLKELDPNNQEVRSWLADLTNPAVNRAVPQMAEKLTIPEAARERIEDEGQHRSLTSVQNAEQMKKYMVGIFREDFVCVSIKMGDRTIFKSGGPEQIAISRTMAEIREIPENKRHFMEKLRLWYFDYFDTTIITPITDNKKEEIGSVSASMNHATINFMGIALLSIMVVIGLIVLLLSMLFSKLFAISFIKPLVDVQRQMNAMSEGDLKEVMNNPIVLKRPLREIENLVDARNRVVKRLKENTDLLEQQNANLETMATDLTEKNGTLQAEIREREEMQLALVEAKEIAVQANQAKSEFLANMSHEIRTPLNAVLGFADLLEDSVNGTKEQRYLENIQSSGKTLLLLINDILDFSKIEAGKMDLENCAFRLDEVLYTLADNTAVKASQKGLELLFDIQTDLPVEMIGDPLRLGQVLINLVGNAIKFSEQGEIIVSVKRIHEDAQQLKLEFSISDHGIGLTEEQQKRLFQAFSQADSSTSREYGGTGLGLAISKQIVTLMDGEIGVQSEFGAGSTFCFTGVFNKPVYPTKNYASKAAVLAGLRVLVVEDNSASREIVAAMLRSFRFHTIVVGTGEEAILAYQAEAKKNAFDLILIDCLLPDMQGIEVVQRLLSDKMTAFSPKIVMLGTYGQQRSMTSSDHVAAYLIKPISPSMLLDTILEVMDKGSVFEIAAQRDSVAYQERASSIVGARILLVEDNEINQELAREILERAGMFVILAQNGREALELLEKEAFDGVLMDCQMPVMDGYQTTAAIRSNPDWEELPVIAMTANAIQGEREKAIAAGMNDHVPKPINYQELFNALIRWVAPRFSERMAATDEVVLEGQVSEPRVRPLEISDPDLEELQGIDVKKGLSIAQHNLELYRRLLARFKITYQDFAGDFWKAREAEDTSAAIRAAHTLKGTAGNIGATELMEAAGKLELACSQGADIKTVKALLEEVQKALQPVLQSLKTLPEISAKEATAQGTNEAEIMSLLQELKRLLSEDDSRALKFFQEITIKTRGSQFENRINELEKPIRSYDLETAYEMLLERFPNGFDREVDQ